MFRSLNTKIDSASDLISDKNSLICAGNLLITGNLHKVNVEMQ